MLYALALSGHSHALHLHINGFTWLLLGALLFALFLHRKG